MINISLVFQHQEYEVEVEEDGTLEMLQFQILSLVEVDPSRQYLEVLRNGEEGDSNRSGTENDRITKLLNDCKNADTLLSSLGLSNKSQLRLTLKEEKAGSIAEGSKESSNFLGAMEEQTESIATTASGRETKNSNSNSKGAATSFDDKVAQLMSMGFEFEQALAALKRCGEDMQRAAAFLLTGNDPGAPSLRLSNAYKRMQAQIQGLAHHTLCYEDAGNQAKALASIPAQKLRQGALEDVLAHMGWYPSLNRSTFEGSMILRGPYSRAGNPPPAVTTTTTTTTTTNTTPTTAASATAATSATSATSASATSGLELFLDLNTSSLRGIKVWEQGGRVAGFVSIYDDILGGGGGGVGEFKTGRAEDSLSVRGSAQGNVNRYLVPDGEVVVAGVVFFQKTPRVGRSSLVGIQIITNKGGRSPLLGHRGHAVAFAAPKDHYLSGICGKFSPTEGFVSFFLLFVNQHKTAQAHRAMQRKLSESESSDMFTDMLTKRLLTWFKGGFFKWTVVNCKRCNGNTRHVGAARPTAEEAMWKAGIVELHQCVSCKEITRFARYNDPVKLLDTRMGRCGEFANAFTLICRSLKIPARHVRDWTDHVWTEVYSRRLGRWVHVDPCERAFDAPLMYEKGWGKKLNYVVSAWFGGVVDVTRRYTRAYEEVKRRRTLVSEQELIQIIATVDKTLKDRIQDSSILSLVNDWDSEEENELEESVRSILLELKEAETKGRITGSVEWKKSRGELGKRTGGVRSNKNDISGSLPPRPTSRVVCVRVNAGLWVDGITFSRQDQTQTLYGGKGGRYCQPFQLEQNEYITTIQAKMGDHLDCVSFITNSGRQSCWYGQSRGGAAKTFKAPNQHMICGLEVGGGMCPPILSIDTCQVPPEMLNRGSKITTPEESKATEKQTLKFRCTPRGNLPLRRGRVRECQIEN